MFFWNSLAFGLLLFIFFKRICCKTVLHMVLRRVAVPINSAPLLYPNSYQLRNRKKNKYIGTNYNLNYWYRLGWKIWLMSEQMNIILQNPEWNRFIYPEEQSKTSFLSGSSLLRKEKEKPSKSYLLSFSQIYPLDRLLLSLPVSLRT